MGNHGTEILPLSNGINWEDDIMGYYGNISEIIFQSWDGNVYIYIYLFIYLYIILVFVDIYLYIPHSWDIVGK